MAAQKDKTIQFWDDLHAAHQKEWILPPIETILEHIYQRLPQRDAPIRLLEIGCGTSTLSRKFYEYCQERPDGPLVYMVATDVSPVCIQQMQQRDAHFTGLRENGSGLEYKILNMVEPLQQQQQEWHSSFDVIFDKGCLDTFAFRSRQRGSQKGVLVKAVLSNIHQLLTDNGAYLVFTPRRKFQPVKEYSGFSRVECIPLGVPKGELVDSNRKAIVRENPELYLYACFKGNHATMESDYNHNHNHNHNPPAVEITLADTDTCPKCGITFWDFRKGEAVEGRGIKFWKRNFKGHGRHCKGVEG